MVWSILAILFIACLAFAMRQAGKGSPFEQSGG